MPAGDLALVARWTENHFVIRFDANGGTGVMADFPVEWEETVELPAATFRKGSTAFVGWSATPDGLVEFADGAPVSRLSENDGDVITLFAKWDRGSYAVHFDPDGGTGEMSDQVLTLDVPQNLSPNAFSKKNHVFVGWAANKGGDVVYADGATVANLASADGAVVTLPVSVAQMHELAKSMLAEDDKSFFAALA